MAIRGNPSELLGLLMVAIVTLFVLGFFLTVAGPQWTHEVAAWLMIPGIFAGIGAFWVVITKGPSK